MAKEIEVLELNESWIVKTCLQARNSEVVNGYKELNTTQMGPLNVTK